MRTAKFLAPLFLLLFAANQAAAQLPAPPAQTAPARVGVAAGVTGRVTLGASGIAGRIIGSGDVVRLGDEITTDENGRLQILLLDETVFTIGPATTLVIDTFVYDPATGNGNIQAQVMKGIFRFISGKIAKKNPGNVKVLLPTGSVGVRGTIFYGRVEGQASTVLLLGPGEKNNTSHREGRILLQNEANGKQNSVEVSKSGFGSRIEGPGAAPVQPFRFSPEQIAEMTSPLLPSADSEEADGSDAQGQSVQPSGTGTKDSTAAGDPGPAAAQDRSAAEQSGQGAFEVLSDASSFAAIQNFGTDLSKQSAEAAQEAAEDSLNTFDNITTVDQLRSIQTGIVHFEGMNFPLFDGNTQNGDFDIRLNINFGTREIGGGDSKIRVQNSTPINGGSTSFLSLPTQNYSALPPGPALYSYDFGVNTLCSTCSGDVLVIFTNEPGVIAQRANVVLAVDTTGPDLIGAGITGPRNDGAAQPF